MTGQTLSLLKRYATKLARIHSTARTRNPSNRAATDARLRPSGHRVHEMWLFTICDYKELNGLLRGFSKVIILFIWSYSCWFCRMCWANADWGLLLLMYPPIGVCWTHSTKPKQIWPDEQNNNLAKTSHSPSTLLPYEQYYIKTLQQEGNLIPDQCPGEINPLFQKAINSQPPLITSKDQLCMNLLLGHYSNLTEPHLQHTANQGMYKFSFTALMNANNTSNYQPT